QPGFPPGLGRRPVRGGLGRARLAARVWRPRAAAAPAGHLSRRACALRRAAGRQPDRPRHPGADLAAFRHGGAEAPVPARHPVQPRGMVPGLFRAGRRVRSGGRAHARRTRRRRLCAQWPQNLDLVRRPRPLVRRAGAHRPAGAAPSRPEFPAGGHARPGRAGRADPPFDRRGRILRSVLRAGARAGRMPAGRGEPGLANRHCGGQFRARHLLHPEAGAVGQGAAEGPRPGAARRRGWQSPGRRRGAAAALGAPGGRQPCAGAEIATRPAGRAARRPTRPGRVVDQGPLERGASAPARPGHGYPGTARRPGAGRRRRARRGAGADLSLVARRNHSGGHFRDSTQHHRGAGAGPAQRLTRMTTDAHEIESMLADAARRFLDERHPPARARDADAGFRAALWGELAAMGWPALLLPEAAGGMGLGLAAAWTLAGEAGRHLLGVPLAANLAWLPGLRAARPEAALLDAWLAPVLAGQAYYAPAAAQADGTLLVEYAAPGTLALALRRPAPDRIEIECHTMADAVIGTGLDPAIGTA